jgi:hypothetical protein
MNLAGNLLASLAESGYGMVGHAAKAVTSDFLRRLRHNTAITRRELPWLRT